MPKLLNLLKRAKSRPGSTSSSSSISSADSVKRKFRFGFSSVLNTSSKPKNQSIPLFATQKKQIEAKMPDHLTESLTSEDMQELQGKNSIIMNNIARYRILNAKGHLNTNEQTEKNALSNQIYTAVSESIDSSKVAGSDKQYGQDMFYLAQAAGYRGHRIKHLKRLAAGNVNGYEQPIVDLIADMHSPESLPEAIETSQFMQSLLINQRQGSFVGVLRSVSGCSARLSDEVVDLINRDNSGLRLSPLAKAGAITAGVLTAAGAGIATGMLAEGAIEKYEIDKYLNNNTSSIRDTTVGYTGEGWHYGHIIRNPEFDKFIPIYHDTDGTAYISKATLAGKDNINGSIEYGYEDRHGSGYIEVNPKTGKPIDGGKFLSAEDGHLNKTMTLTRTDPETGTNYAGYPSITPMNYSDKFYTIENSAYEVDPRDGQPIKNGKTMAAYIDVEGRNVDSVNNQIIDNKTHAPLIDNQELTQVQERSKGFAAAAGIGAGLLGLSKFGVAFLNGDNDDFSVSKMSSLNRQRILSGDKNIPSSSTWSASRITPAGSSSKNQTIQKEALTSTESSLANHAVVELDDNG
jgi:hypothetical protein